MVCWLWFVVCGLWFVVCGLWSVVFASGFGVWGLRLGRPGRHWTRWIDSRPTAPPAVRHIKILCENLFNLKTNFKAILATLQRIIRLFSLKWPKSP